MPDDQTFPASSLGSLPPLSAVDLASGSFELHPAISRCNDAEFIGQLERFKLLRQIGRGGMGEVYLAQDPNRNSTVAIKLLRAGLARHRRSVRFFLKEASHASKLSHPHILPVWEHSSAPPYLVMPFIERGSLSNWLRQNPALGPDQICELMLQICSALVYAHRKGIIHRDLKPSNILIDASNQLYVADFGLALSLVNDALIDVQASSVEGTPNYMSPAMAAGEIEDTRCDIYSLGALLYELLSGCPPYRGAKPREVIAHIKVGPPTPIRELNPNADPILVHIAEKAMARELNERYGHMKYVEADLLAAKENRPLASASEPHSKPSSVAPAPYSPPNTRLPHWFPTGRLVRWTGFIVGLVCLVWWVGLLIWQQRDLLPDLLIMSKIERTEVPNWYGVLLTRLSGSDLPVIALSKENQVILLSLRGETLAQGRGPDPTTLDFNVLHQIDRGTNGELNYLARWSCRSNANVSLLSATLNELKRFSTICPLETNLPGEQPGAQISAAEFGDIGINGSPSVIALIVSGYMKSRRGVQAWDFNSGRELWRYEMASNPRDLVLADLDGDGHQEILVGTHAVENGKQLPDGTDDAHSYVYCLDHSGRLQWQIMVGDKFCISHPRPLDLDHSGQSNIFCWVDSYSDQRTNGTTMDLPRILILSSSGKVLHQFGGSGIDLVSCLPVDLDGDKKTEVLAADRFGRLYCLNSDLTLRQTIQLVDRRFDWVYLRLGDAGDLDGDGKVEVVLSSCECEFVSGSNPGHPDGQLNLRKFHDNKLIVLDSSLHPIASLCLADEWQGDHFMISHIVDDLTGPGAKNLLVLADKVYLIKYRPR
jgi:serine/threonine protein kinase